ncbi:MAG: undecaprenyldiphospho-muramoylpentapeptide beta-N-acetylglucosaminyltransferase [Candidatus Omnitrophica bacterium]|nr:undecaprenyldiphospho-muramoylpentapeptide beta-N-acetylglucosaminyltransferase [Candidatus Omnitrophota bacterium]HOX55226.1 undecaprenyldiphospho-muramoylpentapeptide beta-N-acetylglucosaminyltransferase [Candidatus Omnitrophota bacterium]
MKILFAGSGSGGHIFPALALAEEFSKENNIDVFILKTGNEDIDKQISEKGYKVVDFGLRDVSFAAFGKAFLSVFKLIYAFFVSFSIIARIKPDIVLGFGGYHCGPVVMLAHFLRIPTLIHEQNVVPGKANSILAKFVDKIAVSFPESLKFFPSRKTFFTGCPLRKEIIDVSLDEARKEFNIKDDKFTIFVVGGSQGSHSINSKFLESISQINNKEALRIIHVTGYQDYDFMLKEYARLKVDALVFAFLKKIGYAYKIADMAITRAGASTISELIALRIPALIIPYPFAGGHQLINAEVLSRAGAAIVMEDSKVTAANLKENISSLISDRNIIKRMKSSFDGLQVKNAGENLAREVLSLRKC